MHSWWPLWSCIFTGRFMALLLCFLTLQFSARRFLDAFCPFPSRIATQFLFLKVEWHSKQQGHLQIHCTHILLLANAWFPTTLYLKPKQERRFGWLLGKSRQKHSLGNNIKTLLSYLCLFQLWSSDGTSPCTERRSCRPRQTLKSRHGRRCEDPYRSGILVQTWAGCVWATLRSVSLQSYSTLCSGRPNGWHLQRKTSQSNYCQEAWREAELPPSLLIRWAAVIAISILTKKILFILSISGKAASHHSSNLSLSTHKPCFPTTSQL